MTRFATVLLFLLGLVVLAGFPALDVDARAGSGYSSGSRGSFTYSAPPSTPTAPYAAQPMQRSYSQPTPSYTPSYQQPGYGMGGGFFGRPGGFGTGLIGGFLGAGLFGMLFGHGFFGGMGGGFSVLGLIIQIAVIYFIAKFAFGALFRRTAPLGPDLAAAGSGGSGFAPRAPSVGRVEIGPQDHQAFETLLGQIQDAYGKEDLNTLRRVATPEMVSYFAEDLAENSGRGLVNRVSSARLVKGDLAEAWSEGRTDYATVAMRFSLIDVMVERATGRVVSGDPTHPQEVTEIWTFRRDGGGAWMLSAIQQTQ